MMELLYITWNPNSGFGPFRWYGLCWLIGLALAFFIVKRLYKEQKIKDELFDPLFVYCFIGILLGARLGHCIFYEPTYFLTSFKGFVEMFLPIRFLEGGGKLKRLKLMTTLHCSLVHMRNYKLAQLPTTHLHAICSKIHFVQLPNLII